MPYSAKQIAKVMSHSHASKGVGSLFSPQFRDMKIATELLRAEEDSRPVLGHIEPYPVISSLGGVQASRIYAIIIASLESCSLRLSLMGPVAPNQN